MKKRFAMALLALTLFANFSYAGIDGWIPKSNCTYTSQVSGRSSSITVQQNTWSQRLLSLWGYFFN
jgi:hypothetical protein